MKFNRIWFRYHCEDCEGGGDTSFETVIEIEKVDVIEFTCPICESGSVFIDDEDWWFEAVGGAE